MSPMLGFWLVFVSLLGTYTTHVLAEGEEKPCTVRDGNKYFDLSPLMAKKDYEFQSPEGHKYVLNVCQPVHSEVWNIEHADEIGGFTRRDHGDFSLGYANKSLTVRDGHPMLTMTKGSNCPKHRHMHAATSIYFKCDTSVFGAGTPQLIAQLPLPEDAACYFFFEWRTHVACPSEARPGWGVLSTLAAVTGTLFIVYIIAGALYNYFMLGIHDWPSFIPRFSFFSFSDTAQLFRDCFDRVKDRTGGLHLGGNGLGGWGSRSMGNNGYRGLAEEETGMLHGPPGFLDEEDEDDPEQGHNQNSGNARPAGMDADGVIRL